MRAVVKWNVPNQMPWLLKDKWRDELYLVRDTETESRNHHDCNNRQQKVCKSSDQHVTTDLIYTVVSSLVGMAKEKSKLHTLYVHTYMHA